MKRDVWKTIAVRVGLQGEELAGSVMMYVIKRLLYNVFLFEPKGATREVAKGSEAPPLDKSKLRKDKILGSFDLFASP